jgi:hypothetical protein
LMKTITNGQSRVLVVSEGCLYLAFRLFRIFREAGLGVDLLCQAGDPMSGSRYVDEAIKEPSEERMVERLKDCIRHNNGRWQRIIVAHEKTARALVETNDSSLLTGWQPAACNAEVREFLLSKFGLETAYAKHHLPVPPSRVCTTPQEICEFGDGVGWPLIIKPPDQSGGGGVMRANSFQELLTHLSSVKLPVLAQKFIEGRRGVVDMLCSGGRALAWLASYSTGRNWGIYGPSTARLFCAMPALRAAVERVAAFAQFEGFCGFDWIEETATGKHYLIEFHPRPPSGFRFGRFCGVDFSAAVAAWVNGTAATFPTLVQPPGKPVRAHYFTGDLSRCLRDRDWKGLCAWLPGSGACHDVFWDDMPLFLAWIRARVAAKFTRAR